ncbi:MULTISPECIES: TIGR04211 family SH3 domain-containing protein [Methylophaga]|uniref:SH3 domain-containing protein n=1 Tax=Methylophaga muralis TaxID=291169 RepID=A0A1E3GVT1_9GAMM|nr:MULTISPECIES: TIGR04211 family SH3 domain-containing protein [Methylophaga]ODN68055.1 SH3 domain-containing protein [Methylophaga muralis]THK40436.1 TIGR04211 family SH3 domain-containing protein [Methylophaga sp. SB9B]
MKKIIFSLLLIAAPMLLPSISAAQTTRYVSDELEITMRNGQGLEFGIRKMLKSGTELTVLENDPSGYSKVRTSDGVEGWVLSRYLNNNPSAREQLAAKEQRIANLELEVTSYKEELAQLSSQTSEADDQNMSLKETAQRLSKELDDLRRTASNAVALENENRQLKERLQQIDHEIQSIVIENNTLKDNDAKNWFLIGAAVLFGGMLIGLVMPSLRMRKKSSWGNF